jgi:hypothetical protein
MDAMDSGPPRARGSPSGLVGGLQAARACRRRRALLATAAFVSGKGSLGWWTEPAALTWGGTWAVTAAVGGRRVAVGRGSTAPVTHTHTGAARGEARAADSSRRGAVVAPPSPASPRTPGRPPAITSLRPRPRPGRGAMGGGEGAARQPSRRPSLPPWGDDATPRPTDRPPPPGPNACWTQSGQSLIGGWRAGRSDDTIISTPSEPGRNETQCDGGGPTTSQAAQTAPCCTEQAVPGARPAPALSALPLRPCPGLHSLAPLRAARKGAAATRRSVVVRPEQPPSCSTAARRVCARRVGSHRLRFVLRSTSTY